MNVYIAQEADEILFMFAEQLVSLVDLVGGVEHAVVLIQPLQSLLGVDETFVRNAVSIYGHLTLLWEVS